tara:strand:- start:3088 stop:4179 length:1092 start_codon:yes stop_codon:yes gene_type:complete
MNVPRDTLILYKKKLGKKTITGFKKTHVINKFKDSIIEGNVDAAIRWGVELHSSGHLKQVCNIIIEISSDVVKSPLMFYMIDKYLKKINIINEGFKKILENRNNQETRNLVVDMVYMVTTTDRNMVSIVKIKNSNEYTIISKNLNFILTFRQNEDMNETILACNEILNILYKKVHVFSKIVFWYSWLEKKEQEYKRIGTLFENQHRLISKKICPTSFVWIMWEILFSESKRGKKSQIYPLIVCMYNCYVYNLNKGLIKKRRHILLRAFYLIYSEEINPVIKKFSKRLQVCCNSNVYYGDIVEYINANYPQEELVYKEPDIVDNPNKTIEEKIIYVKKKVEKNQDKELNMEYLFNYDAVRIKSI